MSYSKYSPPSLRSLFTVFKRTIPVTPLAELSLIRHDPMEGNDDLEYWGCRRYLDELKNEIFDEVRSGGFVWETPMPVFSQREYQKIATSLDAAVWEFANIFEGAK